MTIGLIGEFRVGEDIVLALDATDGDAAAVSAITAALKPAWMPDNRLQLRDDAPAVAMTVSPQAETAAGWTISLPAAQSAVLAPGLYGIDARLVVSGGVVITARTAFVSLTQAALA